MLINQQVSFFYLYFFEEKKSLKKSFAGPRLPVGASKTPLAALGPVEPRQYDLTFAQKFLKLFFRCKKKKKNVGRFA